MLIAEIFYSIQGEGALTGVPTVFIRTSGCNLRCRWCDTPYASWKPEGIERSIEEILLEVGRYPARHCVLTGGEPMVAKDIHNLAGRLHAAGFHITIETAGTVSPNGIACDLASLSPKLAHSTPGPEMFGEAWSGKHESLRLQPKILAEWIRHYPYQLKFVLAGAEDLEEIASILASIGETIPPAQVHLMPEGTDSAELRRRSPMIVQLCQEYGYRFCDRLQIHLFGNTKGT
jgi:7-carboxy-7-deazaguanine synthase